MLGRRRFSDVVDRQLELFAGAHEALLDDVRQAERRHRQAGREEAEETFGDLQDRIDWAAEELVAIADAYGATVDDEAAYRRAFLRAARRRFRELAEALPAD